MEEKNFTLRNFTTWISISGIALYVLGWIYWNFFYKSLNIPLSFFDLSFDKVIITTWPFIILAIAGFIPTVAHVTGEKNRSWDIITVIYIVIDTLLLSFYQLLKFDYYLVSFIIISIIYAINILIIHRMKIEVKYISVKLIRYLIIILFYGFGLFLYGYSGRKDALNLIENYQEDCRIVLKDNSEIIGKFITHNNYKTFLIVELNNCKKEIIIINDEEVLKTITQIN
jgi:hypothetical protein